MSKEDLLKKPLKFEIEEIYKVTNIGTVVYGKVIQGKVFPGMKIKIWPKGLKIYVVRFESHPLIFYYNGGAVPGEKADFSISNKELYSEIKKGDIIESDWFLNEKLSYKINIFFIQ